MAHVIAEHMLERVAAFAAPRPRYLRVADVLRTLEQEWYLARELEPLIQSQELEADRIGMSIVCSAGISRRRALTLFDQMARAGPALPRLKLSASSRVPAPRAAPIAVLTCLRSSGGGSTALRPSDSSASSRATCPCRARSGAPGSALRDRIASADIRLVRPAR